MRKCENCYHNEMCQALEICNGITKISADCCGYYKDKSQILELPCKVGDTVYILIIDKLEKFGGAYIKEEIAVEISTAGRIWTDSCYYDSDDIGKTVFFAREEAERELEECDKHETD